MPSLAEVTSILLARSAPVLLVDTCSLVDVIRAPKRAAQLRGCVQAAVELQRMAASAPPECSLVVGSFVIGEWIQHAEATRIELDQHRKLLDEAASDYREACDHLGIAPNAPPFLGAPGLPAALHGLSSDLLGNAIRLEARDETNLRAFARAARNQPPSRKGGEIKDSTILEECLDLCRSLRGSGFARPLVYCTSNTRDYCEAGELHEQLRSEFDPLGLAFVTSLPWAIRELRIEGVRPRPGDGGGDPEPRLGWAPGRPRRPAG